MLPPPAILEQIGHAPGGKPCGHSPEFTLLTFGICVDKIKNLPLFRMTATKEDKTKALLEAFVPTTHYT